jgi:two-component system, NtrC family, response regulator HydG
MPTKPSPLIVDDEQSILQTLQLIFERDGYDVVTAQGCAKALSFLQDHNSFDAVITDLNMEKEDIGLEVARAATKLIPRPAIVVFTGFANSANSEAAFEIGVDYLASKPVEPRELTSAIRRLIVIRGGFYAPARP